MSSLVLLRPDKAGDLIKTLPVIRALQKIAPSYSIHFIVSKANESLLKHEPHVTYSTLPNNWETMPDEELKNTLDVLLKKASFDTAINLLTDPFPQVERLLNLVPANEKFSIFSHNLPVGVWAITYNLRSPAKRNESLNIAEIIERALALDLIEPTLQAERAPKIGLEDIDESNLTLSQKSGLWIGVCPFAGTEQRTHSLKAWESIIGKLCRTTKFEKVLVFGAPSDASKIEEMKNNLKKPSKLTICSPSSFRTLGAFLLKCDRVVAVDSGPLHYSLALGIPSLGFLSGGDYRRWFSQISPTDKIVPRGIFDRYPTRLEMWWHLSRWL